MLFHLSFKMGTLAHSAALCSLPTRLANLYSLKCRVSIFSLLSDRSSNSPSPRLPFLYKINFICVSKSHVSTVSNLQLLVLLGETAGGT